MIFRRTPFCRAFQRKHGRAPTEAEVATADVVQRWRESHPEGSQEECCKALKPSGLIVELTVLLLVVEIVYFVFRFIRERGEWECGEAGEDGELRDAAIEMLPSREDIQAAAIDPPQEWLEEKWDGEAGE